MVHLKKISALVILFACVVSTSCARQAEAPATLPVPAVSVNVFTAAPSPTITPIPTLTPTESLLMTLTPTPQPSPTPDLFSEMSIDALSARSYGGGVLEDLGALHSSASSFVRRLFRYRSDGLNLFGFINLPQGEGPFPIIFMFHGYVDPKEYTTLDYSTRYADALAEEGYIVIHPNLRGYTPSPAAENSLGIGDTIDAMNLVALVRQQAGSDGLLKNADAKHIGLWGHSMGGGVVMRLLVLDADIGAALLYAPIHANEEFNFAHFDEDGRGYKKPEVSAAELAKISPLGYLDRITAPLSIHQGGKDTTVPPEWSEFLCAYLVKLDKKADCLVYPDQPHTFQNSGDALFIANTELFFDEFIKK